MGLTWSSAAAEDGEIAVSETPATEVLASDTPVEIGKVEESDEERRKRREEELIKFKDDLAAKRDLRKKKLGEVSDELKFLKDQLQQEVNRRKELEQQLVRYKNGNGEITNTSEGTNISAEVDSLRISKYDDDDEDDIDILEEDEEHKEDEASKRKRKGIKKKVSFSLDLVKEEEFDPHENVDAAEEVVNDNDETSSRNENNEENADQEEESEMSGLVKQNKKLENQVRALKDVANLSKQLLGLRESQVEELNKRMVKVEEKEKDYDRKIAAMKELRRLYDEKSRAMFVEHKHQLETEKTRVTVLESKLRFAEETNEDLLEQKKHLTEKVKNLDNKLDAERADLSDTKIKLATEKESLYHASSQISLINNLVSQVISGPELDLDHLARFLEDNHALINELTAKGEIDYVASALVGVAGGIVEVPKEEKSDIAENLGKVWRVLVELLSHHKKSESEPTSQEWESCYKSVDTPKGPKLVISVSQTFIKLKDLILEKNSLVKEVGRLKTLNEHLENRMEEQGGRLSLVTEELHNTWDVVNKLKRQHDNLHTHERILKHELQHKRSMLNGLKKQLELCREQWDLAREKNSKTENDWLLLRAEFAMRKQKKKIFNSAESGYEDEETQSPEYDTDDDKSLEIEEESPENSVGENLNQQGSLSPSTSESNSVMDECNGPISEILDGIFDEAYKIARASKNGDQLQPKTSTEHVEKNVEDPNENMDSDIPLEFYENNVFEVQNINDRVMYATFCDVPIKRLEQIPEVEEDTSDTLSKESDDNKDKPEVISVTNLKGYQIDTTTETDNSFEETSHTDKTENKVESVKCENERSPTPQNENQEKSETANLTTDEILRRREERLKRMEESCKSLFIKMGQTSNRGNEISNKLDQIHAIYGPQQSTDDQTSSTSLNQLEYNTSTTSSNQPEQNTSMTSLNQLEQNTSMTSSNQPEQNISTTSLNQPEQNTSMTSETQHNPPQP